MKNSIHNCCSHYIIIIIQRHKFSSKLNRLIGSKTSLLHSSAITWESSPEAPYTPFEQPAALSQTAVERKAWQAKQLAPSHHHWWESCEHSQSPKSPGRFCTHLGSCCLLLLPSPAPSVSNTTGVRHPSPLHWEPNQPLRAGRNYRFCTTRQSLLSSRKAIRKFPEPWLSIILLSLKPSQGSIAEVLRPVSFHHTAKQKGSTSFHPPFLSFFPPAKRKK